MISLQIKRGISTDWSSENPVLKLGELGYVTDMNVLKIGDGVTDFVTLNPYSGVSGSTQFKPGIYIGRTGSGADYICDGVEDNVQIQAAIDAIPAGGVIYILPGTYYCAVRITKTGKSFSIIGIGTVNIIFTTAGTTSNNPSYNGFDFRGTVIIADTQTLTVSATAGDMDITVSSSSGVLAGDLINVSDSVVWDTTYKTGEIYLVDDVYGTSITLNEPLVHSHTTGNSAKISVYRPIEIHLVNLQITMGSSALNHMAITGKLWKNSTVENCKIENSGLSAIAVYDSYNIEVKGCTIKHSMLPGSGYGISMWSGTAYADIHDNHVENCRHCISVNSDSTNTLNRRIHIHHNFILGGEITGAQPLDAHQQCIDLVVDYNIIVARANYYACILGSKYTEFSHNMCYGGTGAVTRRGDVDNVQMLIKDNYVYPLAGSGYLYRAFTTHTGESMEIVGNHLYGGAYGIMFNDNNNNEVESYKNLIIKNNYLYNLAYDGIVIKANANGMNVDISNNYINDCAADAIYIDSNSFTYKFVNVSGNVIIDPNTGNSGGSGVCLVNTSYAIVDGNKMYDSNSRSGYGVRTTGTSDYNVVINNVARGMGTKYSLAGEHNQDSGNITM